VTATKAANAGNISAMRCVIHDLSHDISTITPEQLDELIDLNEELCSLLLDITRREQ